MTATPVAGARLSLTHCGRCHVIGDINRMKGPRLDAVFCGACAVLRTGTAGSPQFFVLRPQRIVHPDYRCYRSVRPPNSPPAHRAAGNQP